MRERNPVVISLRVAMQICKLRHLPAHGSSSNKDIAGIVWERPQEVKDCRINCFFIRVLFLQMDDGTVIIRVNV